MKWDVWHDQTERRQQFFILLFARVIFCYYFLRRACKPIRCLHSTGSEVSWWLLTPMALAMIPGIAEIGASCK